MGTFKACIDLANMGFICRWATPTDTVQSIRTWITNPLDCDSYLYDNTAVAATVSTATATDFVTDSSTTPTEARFFGKEYFIADVTGASSEGIKIFTDGATYKVTTTINKIYTVSFWIKSATNDAYPSDTTYRARLYSDSYTISRVQTTGTAVNSAWTQVSLSYTAPASNNMVLQVVKTDASARRFYIAGVIVFESTSAVTVPAGYNTGQTIDLYNDITTYVKSMSWQVGMFKPYQQMCDEGVATLQLDNSTAVFTPANASCPLFGYLTAAKWFEIGHWLGTVQTTYRKMYTGQTDSPAVKISYKTAGANSGKTDATLTAVSNRIWLDTQDFEYPNAANANIGTTIKEILGSTNFASGVGFGYADKVGARAGTVTNYAPQADDTAWQTIADLVAVEEGKFYIDRRRGTVNLISKYYSYSGGTPYGSWSSLGLGTAASANAGTIAETGSYKPYQQLQYAYGANYINRVRVTVHPRNSNASGTVWQNSSMDYDIAASSTDTMIVRLRDSLGRFTTCTSLSISLLTYSSGTATTTVTPKGGKAYIDFNNAGTISAVLSSLALTGASASQQNDIAIEVGSAGTATYGIRLLSLDLRASGSARQGRAIARHILDRDNSFQGYVYSVPFKNKGDGTSNAHQLQWDIGTKLRVDIDSLSHDREYWIIGEKHQVMLDGDVHDTTFALEPYDVYYAYRTTRLCHQHSTTPPITQTFSVWLMSPPLPLAPGVV